MSSPSWVGGHISSSQLLALSVLAVVLTMTIWPSSKSGRRPPGPDAVPILGNATQVPPEKPWLTFSKWAQTYGDVVFLNLLGKPAIVINSASVARELLEKKSSIYSDRPQLNMAELAGFHRTTALLPYGDTWRKQRKALMQDLSTSGVVKYQGVQELAARRLTLAVLERPDDFDDIAKFHIGSVIMRATYGVEISGVHDTYLTMPMQAMKDFADSVYPGKWAVDMFPSLKKIPSWFPGAGFRGVAARWNNNMSDASWRPYNFAKERFLEGNALVPNFCQSAFEAQTQEGQPLEEMDEILVWATSAMMGGGLDTNMATVATFFKAMVMYPEVQIRARKELDTVVGQDRLPNLADINNLPFIRAVFAETMRWTPASPFAIPHALSEDDVYDGFTLPKKTIVFPNTWFMTHDPKDYPDPETFNPDRFQGDDAFMLRTQDLVFGYGRRVCPGKHFAHGTIVAIMATVLATCEITPYMGPDGKPVIPSFDDYEGTSVVFQKPFKFRIKPRSDRAKELLTYGIRE